MYYSSQAALDEEVRQLLDLKDLAGQRVLGQLKGQVNASPAEGNVKLKEF